MNETEKFTVAIMVLVCAAGYSSAQPTNDRLPTEWRATNGVETWIILDDGRQTPMLSGYYRSNAAAFYLAPARFDFGSNVLRTVAVGQGGNRKVEIKYVSPNHDDNSIDALIRTNRVRFFEFIKQ